MKLFVWVLAMIGLLGGAAVVLLRTNQAPLVEDSSGPVEASVETAEQTSPKAEESAGQMNLEGFRALGAEVMRSFPSKESLKERKEEETIELPPPLVLVSLGLSRISDSVKADPALEDEAFALYESCAGSSLYPDTVRALCFLYYRKSARRLGKPASTRVAPLYIRRFADQLAQ